MGSRVGRGSLGRGISAAGRGKNDWGEEFGSFHPAQSMIVYKRGRGALHQGLVNLLKNE